MKSKFHNKHKCPVCNSNHKVVVTDTCHMYISECRTYCDSCGHKDYWGYGFYSGLEGDGVGVILEGKAHSLSLVNSYEDLLWTK